MLQSEFITWLKRFSCPVNDDSFTRYEAVRKEYRDMLDPVSFLAFYWFDDVNEVVHLHCKVRACTPANKQQCEAPQSKFVDVDQCCEIRISIIFIQRIIF